MLYLLISPITFLSFSFVQVREDPVFRREGSNIHVDAVLSITQVMFLNEKVLSLCLVVYFRYLLTYVCILLVLVYNSGDANWWHGLDRENVGTMWGMCFLYICCQFEIM